MNEASAVALVHGLWYGRASMLPLARRLGRAGREVRLFHYRSLRGGLEVHAEALHRWVAGARLDFLAHSLGGLVLLRMLSHYPDLAPGRAVLLGTPLWGSQTARRARVLPGGRWLLGEAGPDLEQGFSALPEGWQVGLIAGSRRLGLGLLVGAGHEPGDGTVLLRETRLAGLADWLALPVSHTGLLLAREVFQAARDFLATGRFSPVSGQP